MPDLAPPENYRAIEQVKSCANCDLYGIDVIVEDGSWFYVWTCTRPGGPSYPAPVPHGKRTFVCDGHVWVEYPRI